MAVIFSQSRERKNVMNMKRVFALLLTLAMALSLAACGAKKEEAPAEAAEAPAEERRQIRVGMECAYAPNNWQEDTATDLNVPIENLPGFYADGNDVQIARHIAEYLDADLVVVKLAWSGLIEALNQGQIDMIIAGMADTEERRQSINFSDPYHSTEYALMLLPDSQFVGGTTIHDFAGASVLGQKDTKLDTVIDQMDGVNHLPPVESVPNMISRLDQGTCDAIVINLENAPGYLALNPDYVIVEFAEGDGFELGFTGSCVGLRKSDTDLLQQVNASLAEYSQDELTALWDWAVENQPT